jgi:hypothetical protein
MDMLGSTCGRTIRPLTRGSSAVVSGVQATIREAAAQTIRAETREREGEHPHFITTPRPEKESFGPITPHESPHAIDA